MGGWKESLLRYGLYSAFKGRWGVEGIGGKVTG